MRRWTFRVVALALSSAACAPTQSPVVPAPPLSATRPNGTTTTGSRTDVPWPLKPAPTLFVEPSPDDVEMQSDDSETLSPEVAAVLRDAATQEAPTEQVLVDADACPAPLETSEPRGLAAYQAFVDRALDLPPRSDSLIVVHVSPSFLPDRTLSLHRRPNGRYFLRAERLDTYVWGDMLTEIGSRQGCVSLDERSQAAALSRVTTGKEVIERLLDARTARLFVELWRSLLGRVQVVEPVGILMGRGDGVNYRIWHNGKGLKTWSPHAGTILGEAISATERLAAFVARSSSNEESDLAAARGDMEDALARTRRHEPCLRPYTGDR